MINITVRQMVKNFLDSNPSFELPKLKNIITAQERISSTLSSIQMNKISQILESPEDAIDNPDAEGSIDKITSWNENFNKLKEEGLGREELIKKLPDFEHPDKIISTVYDLYSKDPVDAGKYAQKYLGYTPYVDYYNLYEREVEEPFEELTLPTSDIVRFQFDLLSIDALYEFKLTIEKYKVDRLREALIQIYIYDFLMRLKNNILHYHTLIIEIYLVDKQQIYQYGGIFSKGAFDVDKQVLKEVFKVNKFNNLDLLNKTIDNIYDNLQVVLEEDVDNLLRQFQHR